MGRFDDRSSRTPRWEPEPLHLPLALPNDQDLPEKDRGDDDDLPGRSVVVIDLA